jgi:hypothetical protein
MNRTKRAWIAVSLSGVALLAAGVALFPRFGHQAHLRLLFWESIADAPGYYFSRGPDGNIRVIFRWGESTPVVTSSVYQYKVVDMRLVVSRRQGTGMIDGSSSRPLLGSCHVLVIDLASGKVASAQNEAFPRFDCSNDGEL